MADKKDKPAEQPAKEGAEAPAPKKGLPIKTIAVIAVVMALEAGAIVMVMGMLGPKKSEAAVDPKSLVEDTSHEIKEIQIIADKFQNLTTGKVWVWDIDVYVQVKEKNAERVEKVLEQRSAEIKEGLNQIVARAQHAQLKEPERQSLSRQFTAYLEKVIGMDPDGKSLLERLLIPKCRGFPADF